MALGNIEYSALPLRRGDVVDNLESTACNLPLSANQGRLLCEKGEKLFLKAVKRVYVNAANGSDVAGDGTQANPWATIQKAVDECVPTTSGFVYSINIADGTYVENVNIMGNRTVEIAGSEKEYGVVIQGNITVARGAMAFFNRFLKIEVKSGRLAGLYVYQNCYIYFSNDSKTYIDGCGAFGGIYIYENSAVRNGSSNGIIIVNTVRALFCDVSNFWVGKMDIDDTNAVGLEAQTGGKISINGSLKNNAVKKYYTHGGGAININAQGWVMAGKATGTNAIPIDSELFTEFLIHIKIGVRGSVTAVVPSLQLPDAICATGYVNKDIYWFAAVLATKTTMNIYQAIDCGMDCLNLDTTKITVYGRRA